MAPIDLQLLSGRLGGALLGGHRFFSLRLTAAVAAADHFLLLAAANFSSLLLKVA